MPAGEIKLLWFIGLENSEPNSAKIETLYLLAEDIRNLWMCWIPDRWAQRMRHGEVERIRPYYRRRVELLCRKYLVQC